MKVEKVKKLLLEAYLIGSNGGWSTEFKEWVEKVTKNARNTI